VASGNVTDGTAVVFFPSHHECSCMTRLQPRTLSGERVRHPVNRQMSNRTGVWRRPYWCVGAASFTVFVKGAGFDFSG
jgi:hypothetical protein